MAYNLTKKVPYSFEETLEKTKSALGRRRFGIISEIDQAILRFPQVGLRVLPVLN